MLALGTWVVVLAFLSKTVTGNPASGMQPMAVNTPIEAQILKNIGVPFYVPEAASSGSKPSSTSTSPVPLSKSNRNLVASNPLESNQSSSIMPPSVMSPSIAGGMSGISPGQMASYPMTQVMPGMSGPMSSSSGPMNDPSQHGRHSHRHRRNRNHQDTSSPSGQMIYSPSGASSQGSAASAGGNTASLQGIPSNLSPQMQKMVQDSLKSAGNIGDSTVTITADDGKGNRQTFNPGAKLTQRPSQRKVVDLMKDLKSWITQPRPYEPTPVDTSSLPDADKMSPLNQDCLVRHNQIRKSFGLQIFTYSLAAVQFAESRIKTLTSTGVFKHDMNPFREFGENLYRWRQKKFLGSCDFAIYKWATEEKPLYHGQGIGTGRGMYTHYTAIIWPASNQMGCAEGLDREDKHYIVCGYYPRGNDAGARLQVY